MLWCREVEVNVAICVVCLMTSNDFAKSFSSVTVAALLCERGKPFSPRALMEQRLSI